MTKVITSDHAFFGFGPELEAVAEVEKGEQVIFETLDCFSCQLESASDTLDELDWSITNPATGPVYIKGVKAGDTVKVKIDKIELKGQSVMCVIPGAGGLGDLLTEKETVILPIEGDTLKFRDSLELKTKPMIGVIGVAHPDRTVPNSTPDIHGGNMDTNRIAEGATLYLKAGLDGALFGLGDLHALMGDGEILICGAETPGVVTVTLDTTETAGIPTPFVEDDEVYVAIASAETADEAHKMAGENMHKFLTGVAGLSANDAGLLMSLVGNLIFSQVVDPLITVRFEFPKKVLAELGFSGIA